MTASQNTGLHGTGSRTLTRDKGILRPWGQVSNVVDVRSHGTVGDGSTNDTAAIQAAFNAAATAGQPCYLPAATYIATGLTWPAGLKLVYGDGNDLTIIKRPGADSAISYIITASSRSDFTLAGICLDGNKASQTRAGHNLMLQACSDFTLRDVRSIGAKASAGYGDGLVLNATASTNSTGRGIRIEDCEAYDNDANGLDIQATSAGITVEGGVYSANGLAGISHTSPAAGGTETGINTSILDVRAERNGGAGISLGGFIQTDGNYGNADQGIAGVLIDGCQVYENGRQGIVVQSDSTTVSSCTVRGNGTGSDAGILVNAIRTMITGCEIASNTAFGIDLGGAERPTVSNCSIHDNTGSGINVGGSQQVLIEGNQFADNGGAAVAVNRYDGGGGYGFTLEGGQVHINLNRIINTVSNALYGIICSDLPSNVRITNNSFQWPDANGNRCIYAPIKSGEIAGNVLERTGALHSSYVMNAAATLVVPEWVDEVWINSTTTINSIYSYTQNDTSGKLLGVDLTAAGSGYTASFAASVTGGGGAGAAVDGTPKRDGLLAFPRVMAAGSGYGSAPAIGLNGGGGTGATGTATIGPAALVTGRKIALVAHGVTMSLAVGAGNLVLPVAAGETLALPSGSRIVFAVAAGVWKPVSVQHVDGRPQFDRITLAGGIIHASGPNTPEGAVTAPIGSTWSRTNGGAGTSFYVKESGVGNTGWVAK